MADTSRMRLVARGGIELLVVVLGILIALGVDRWAQRAEDREMQRAYLSRLEADLVADSFMLAQWLGTSEDALAAVHSLRDAVRSGQPAARLYFSALGPSYPPSSTSVTYEELESTGHLSLLQSESVRRAVVGRASRLPSR